MKRGLLSLVVLVALLSGFFYVSPNGDVSAQEIQELIEKRTRTSKTFNLGETSDGRQRYALDASIGSVHYKDNPDNPDEQWKNIDTTIVSSPKPNWDWEVIKGNWHLLIKDDTTVALGKDGNWIGFQYTGLAYIDWVTKDYVILDTRADVTPTISGNKIRWENIFYGCNLEYIYTPDGFKENLEVTQQARDWLTANPPSSFGLSNQTSYLVGYIQTDFKDAYPAEDEDGNSVNWDDYEAITKSTFWRHPVKDKLVTALPIGYAIHENVLEEDWVNIRYRFYKHTDGNHYLLFGAKVADLNQYPVGTIVIDPTLDEQVGASSDDAEESGATGGVTLTGPEITMRSGTATYNQLWGGHRFVSGEFPAQGTTIDVAYLRVYVFHTDYDDANINLHFEELAAPATFTTDASDITSRDRTEASTSWVADSIGSGWQNSPSLCGVGSPAQELFDSYSPTAIVVIARPNTDASKVLIARAWDYDDNTLGAYLHLEWTVGVVAPTVITNVATSVEETTATLSGNITATGGENCTDRGFQWDIDTGAPYADNWTEAGSFGVGNFTHGITALTEGELYYYRAGANNTAGWGWGAEVTFLTKPDEPNTLVATGGYQQVSLSWNKGTGADNTTITAKLGSYPANRADGTVIYDDTGTNTNHTGLGDSEHWYYRAWSWCTEGGKSQYSDIYAQDDATTLTPTPPAPPRVPAIPLPQPVGEKLSLVLAGCAVIFFSELGFWRQNALLFMLAGGASLMVGLQWYDVYVTSTGLTAGLMLIAYSFVCIAFAFRYLFWRGDIVEE